MNLLTLTSEEFCTATHACNEGREFALRHATMAEAWDACPHPDWLLWIARKVDRVPDDRTLRLFAVWCARHTPLGDGRITGDLCTDPRSLAALEMAERHAHGQATDAELAYAANAGNTAAADAFNVARATHSTAHAAHAAHAARAAAAAACTHSTHVAYATYAANAAYAAAAYTTAASRAQADQFRRMVANPFRKEDQP